MTSAGGLQTLSGFIRSGTRRRQVPLHALIVDEQRLFAEAIREALIGIGADPVCVRTRPDEARLVVPDHRPDLVLVEIALDGGSGLQLGAELVLMAPSSKVVALTTQARPGVVRRVMAAGFHGFLTKDTSAERFERSVRAIVDGQLVVPERLGKVVAQAKGAIGSGPVNGGAGSNIGGFVDGRGSPPRVEELLSSQLTGREREVLELLTKGSTSLAIARTLRVSPNTVRTHVQSIMYKLQVHSRLEAAAFAVRHGVVAPE